uniref:Uncharacterized protein n=1 Tax=Meloidogyne floridensis TaxID=298350 RepID=A0A915NER5_9BILA
MEFWSNFSKNYNLKQYRDLIGRALIAKGAKTEEIEYKLNKMKENEALDLLRDYYKYCHQKIKDIENEVKEKANDCVINWALSDNENRYKCPLCREEIEFNEAHKEFKERMKKAGFTFEDDVEN